MDSRNVHMKNVAVVTFMTFVVRLLRLLMKPIVPTARMMKSIASSMSASGLSINALLTGSYITRTFRNVTELVVSIRLVNPAGVLRLKWLLSSLSMMTRAELMTSVRGRWPVLNIVSSLGNWSVMSTLVRNLVHTVSLFYCGAVPVRTLWLWILVTVPVETVNSCIVGASRQAIVVVMRK